MQSVPLVFILGLVILAVIDKARVRNSALLCQSSITCVA
jgi:hypothetical protein